MEKVNAHAVRQLLLHEKYKIDDDFTYSVELKDFFKSELLKRDLYSGVLFYEFKNMLTNYRQLKRRVGFFIEFWAILVPVGIVTGKQSFNSTE